MDGIKDTILLLCNLVNQMYEEQLLSVHFSHAKFDRTGDHVVFTLWRVIHKIVCEKRTCDVAYCVKKKMLTRQNYRMASFYALPNDNSYGSRELLLALGKLVADSKLEEELDKMVSKSVLISEFGCEADISHSDQTNEPCDPTSFDDDDSCFKYIVFKAGKIRNTLQTIEQLREQRQIGTEKIHADTSSIPCVSHLSALEVLALSNKKHNYPRYQKQLQRISGLLDAYLLWSKRKKQFLKWIVSVIELKKHHDLIEQRPDGNGQKKSFLLQLFLTQLDNDECQDSGVSDYSSFSAANASVADVAVRALVESMVTPLVNNGFKILQKS